MPYSIDTSRKTWRITLSGTITTADILTMLKEAQALEKGKPVVPHRLVDWREMLGINLSFSLMDALAPYRMSNTLPNKVKSALLTKGPVQYAFAHMYETLLRHPQIEVHVFQNEAEAIRWLEG